MAVIATRLSRRVEVGFAAMTSFRTTVVELKSGATVRNADRALPIRTYSASYAALSPSAREEILAAQMACMGQVHAFLFCDWADYKAVGQSLGNAPSGTTPVQLVKSYTFGATTTNRTIKRPVNGTVTVYEAGVAKAGTINTTTGLFTPSSSWTAGQPLTADFQFDTLVRFDSDELQLVLPHRDIAEIEVTLREVLE